MRIEVAMHWESHMTHRVVVGRGILALFLLVGCSKEPRESTAVAQAKLEVPGLVAAYNLTRERAQLWATSPPTATAASSRQPPGPRASTARHCRSTAKTTG